MRIVLELEEEPDIQAIAKTCLCLKDVKRVEIE
jgi:hypothetical protein